MYFLPEAIILCVLTAYARQEIRWRLQGVAANQQPCLCRRKRPTTKMRVLLGIIRIKFVNGPAQVTFPTGHKAAFNLCLQSLLLKRHFTYLSLPAVLLEVQHPDELHLLKFDAVCKSALVMRESIATASSSNLRSGERVQFCFFLG